MPNPRDRLQSALESDVKSGEVSETDATAISSALDSIDSSLKSAGDAARRQGGKPPSPDEMKEKVAGLIKDQVDSGAITEDQGSEIASLFDKVMGSGPQGAAGGPPPEGGPPPPPPPGEESGSDQASGSSDSDDALLNKLVEMLQKMMETKSSSYSANARSTTDSSTSGLLLDVSA